MTADVYRYRFAPDTPADEVEATLALAVVSVECLHGAAQVRLDGSHAFDAEGLACVVDAGTAVGRDLNRLFAGFAAREFGPDAFTVERLAAPDRRRQRRRDPTPA